MGNKISKGRTTKEVSIPFNRVHTVGSEFEYISRAIASRNLSGDGYFTKKTSRLLERHFGCERVFLTTSCTHALEMTALLLDIQPGDEVIVPSFTFVSTANAYALRGAKIVFIDIRPDTLNMDERLLPGLITSKTKAIVPVHYAGISCDMDAINSIAKEHGITVIEDNAHGLFGRYKGRPLGTLGDMSTLSFHETKNITCGEAGAIVLNDDRWIESAEIIREKGTNRSLFFRGETDSYSWHKIGSSYLPSEILVAFLYAQLKSSESIQARREKIWQYYYDNLRDWAINKGVQLPYIPSDCQPAWHLFSMIMPTCQQRDGLIEHLSDFGIKATFHYMPLHLSHQGKKYVTSKTSCPVTQDLPFRLIRLPFYTDMSTSQLAEVVKRVKSFALRDKGVRNRC